MNKSIVYEFLIEDKFEHGYLSSYIRAVTIVENMFFLHDINVRNVITDTVHVEIEKIKCLEPTTIHKENSTYKVTVFGLFKERSRYER